MLHGRIKQGETRKLAFRIDGLLLLLLAVGSLVSSPAGAESNSCFPRCPAPTALYELAGSDYDAYRAAREERMRLREERRLEREREAKVNRSLRNLERKLDRAERENGHSRYRNRMPSGSNDGQAGAHCMYGPDGRLIYAPRGETCSSREGGLMPGPTGVARAVAQGCAVGDCKNGDGTYVWANGARYQGGFENGLQHGQGSIAFPTGASYVGAWDQGKRSGMGTAIYPDGRVQAGRWSENKFLGDTTSPSAPIARIDWPDLSKPAEAVGGGAADAAVIVGIQDYAHVAKVPGAERNAIDWYRYLVKTRGVPSERVTLLLDEDATREEIQLAAEEAARTVGKKGQLWFVFIGHGASAPGSDDGLLIGFDAQQKARSLRSRSLGRRDLVGILEASQARNIHVFLDACFSGQSPSGEPLLAGLQPLVVTSSAPTSDPRTTLMTAAASDQFAGPLPGASRPAFSYLLLGGLRGWADQNGDGKIQAGELHGYARKTMRTLIRGRRQTPTMIGDEDTRLAHSASEAGPDVSDLLIGASPPARAR